MASPSPFRTFHGYSSQIKKSLLPQWEQGQKIHFCGTTLFAGFSDRSATVPTHRLPLTQAIRQQILRDTPFSPCPRRPIYCPALRSALSFAELSVDALAVLLPLPRFTYDGTVILYLCSFVKHKNPPFADNYLPPLWLIRYCRGETPYSCLNAR